MEISIIIPVCNVSRYLTECLDSICRQHFEDTEVILIDDGSTDQSGEICDAYGAAYTFVHAAHQPNQGPSAARNAGIRAASGRYLLFIDGDDHIACGSIAAFLREIKARPADLYFLKAEKIYPNGKKAALDGMGGWVTDSADKLDVLRNLAEMPKFPGSACTKLVSRQMVLEHDIYFEEGVRAEDLIWSLRCILCAGSYGYIGADYYYYRQMRMDSAANMVTGQGAFELYRALMQGMELAEGEKAPICTYVRRMMAYEAEVLLLYYGRLGRDERKNMKKEVRSACRLLKYRKKARTRLIRVLVSLLGVDAAGTVLSKAYSLREWYFL